jgi:hypothetical protein
MEAHVARATTRSFGSFVCLRPIPAIALYNSCEDDGLAASCDTVAGTPVVDPTPEAALQGLKIFDGKPPTSAVPPNDEGIRHARCA